MEVCGRDESKQVKDAGVDEELHAHDAVDQHAHEDMDTKYDVVGLQKKRTMGSRALCVCVTGCHLFVISATCLVLL